MCLGQEIRRLVIGAIMATDPIEHFAITSQFCRHGCAWSPASPEESLLLGRVILHAADLSRAARPLPIQAAMAARQREEYGCVGALCCPGVTHACRQGLLASRAAFFGLQRCHVCVGSVSLCCFVV